ncbi:50S ribosomal protein L29 [Aureispira sp. CCB-E]|uniref:50S ribosomal protein L29 n=1 Tax=Aureispira sp. CCB-E TaxID=3051121 RepID=UPI0007C7FD60|nr:MULTISPECIES: 50S ribosomal protein L29 [unclassified Aureispira]WMX14818.1 50S ribosomal protein L29 [Aureispira sp. CCB-E]
MAKLELKGLSVQELNEELETTQKHYYSLKFNNAVSSLENTAEIKTVRRNIARIKTEIRAKELAESTQKRDKIQARRRLAKKIKK